MSSDPGLGCASVVDGQAESPAVSAGDASGATSVISVDGGATTSPGVPRPNRRSRARSRVSSMTI